MDEINNKTVVVLLIATIVVSLVGSVTVLTKLSDVRNVPGATGFAVDDTGVVNISISQALMIEVNSTYDTVDFGSCSVPSEITSISSEWSAATIAANPTVNCTGTNLPAGIVVKNIGNVAANITIQTDAVGTTLVGQDGVFRYRAANLDGATGTPTTTWTDLAAIGDQDYMVVEELQVAGGQVNVTFNFTLGPAATTSGGESQATLTFYGEAAGSVEQ